MDTIESDNWYRRNYSILNPNDETTRFITTTINDVVNIFEAGCADGYRLEFLRNHYGLSNADGCDISKRAIQTGKLMYPWLKLSNGNILDLKNSSNVFELVIAQGVLCYVNRISIEQAIHELFRVSTKYVYIGDFAPVKPFSNINKHAPDQYVHHQDYTHLIEVSHNVKVIRKEYYGDTEPGFILLYLILREVEVR